MIWKGKSRYDTWRIKLSNWGVDVVEPLSSISAQLRGNLGLSSVIPKGSESNTVTTPSVLSPADLGRLFCAFLGSAHAELGQSENFQNKNQCQKIRFWELGTKDPETNCLVEIKIENVRTIGGIKALCCLKLLRVSQHFLQSLDLGIGVLGLVILKNMLLFHHCIKGGRHRRVSIGTTAGALLVLDHILLGLHIFTILRSFISQNWSVMAAPASSWSSSGSSCDDNNTMAGSGTGSRFRFMDWAGRRSREFAGRHSREFAGRRSRECRRVIILIRAVDRPSSQTRRNHLRHCQVPGEAGKAASRRGCS